MNGAPARYQLAWLATGWRGALLAPPPAALAREIEGWIDRGLPALVRRRQPGEEEGVPLGIALPPGGAARRAALRVEPGALARLAPLPSLAEALRSAPEPWRVPLADLEAAARPAGLALRVHGSLAWQHLAGQPYLHPASDVDLLFRPQDGAALERALSLLGARAEGPPRLDGEALFGDAAVSWRELGSGRARVLARRDGGAELLSLGSLLGRLGAEASP